MPASRSRISAPVTPRAVVVRRVPAVSRAAAILRLLGGSEAPLGVQAIARALGLVPSTCLHILRALAAEQFVAMHPETKQYSLAAGLITLARTSLRRNTFGALAQPELDALARTYGVTAIAVQPIRLEHMVVVGLSRSNSALRIHVDVGSRFPALISATGRCIAAFGDHRWREIERRFKALRWDNPPSLRQWREEIEATRRAGFAVDDGRYIGGVTIIAAPVPVGSVVNTLVVVGLREQLRRVGDGVVGDDLRARATQLSRRLGEAALAGSRLS